MNRIDNIEFINKETERIISEINRIEQYKEKCNNNYLLKMDADERNEIKKEIDDLKKYHNQIISNYLFHHHSI
jgi:hypothetical protein